MKYQNFFEGVAVVEDSIADRYINEGIEQGINQGILKVAKKSILTGLENETIRIITGLTFVQIDKIRKELEQK